MLVGVTDKLITAGRVRIRCIICRLKEPAFQRRCGGYLDSATMMQHSSTKVKRVTYENRKSGWDDPCAAYVRHLGGG